MNSPMFSRTASQESALQTNKVLRNTYALLSMTLLWSAVVAGVSMAMNLPRPGSYYHACWFLRPTFPNREEP